MEHFIRHYKFQFELFLFVGALFYSTDKIVSSKSVSSHASICAPKLNEIRTKEQIEKRRLEAKKRLLFNKKYKSV